MLDLLKISRALTRLPMKWGKVAIAISETRTTEFWRTAYQKTDAIYALGMEGVTKITADHPDVKLSALGKAFEEMLEHPLSKRFLKNRPQLYMSDYPVGMQHAVAKTPNVIVLSKDLVNASTSDELQWMAGHELAHVIRGDMHPNQLGFWSNRIKSHSMERMADEIGVIISGKGAHAAGMIETLSRVANPPEFAESHWLSKWVTDRAYNVGNRTYPSIPKRKRVVKNMVEQIEKKGQGFVEEEVKRRLEEVHNPSLPF